MSLNCNTVLVRGYEQAQKSPIFDNILSVVIIPTLTDNTGIKEKGERKKLSMRHFVVIQRPLIALSKRNFHKSRSNVMKKRRKAMVRRKFMHKKERFNKT